MNLPLCFVLMPFGKKHDFAGTVIDFDAVYEKLIVPSIREAELEPIRADEEIVGGIIHKPMFERLILCQYAVADLTTANANVFYELGVRHALRPYSTVPVFAEGPRLPFDVAPIRALPYKLTKKGHPTEIDQCKAALVQLLQAARNAATDSPVFQLVDGLHPAAVDHTKTDVFQKQVQYSEQIKQQLAAARKQGLDAVKGIEKDLGNLADLEAGVVVDLFLSYRAVEGWQQMIELAARIPAPLQQAVMIQEQFALALNRAGQGDRAEQVLLAVLQRNGPSSETHGLLGRVYKDRWEAVSKAGSAAAPALLDKAIDAYRKGFEADWRDAYPGVNAITLMEVREPPLADREKLKPLVRYAAERKIATAEPDYWDYATLLEIAVLESDENSARDALSKALACLRESWEAETTLRNLRLISNARAKRGSSLSWTASIENALETSRSTLKN
jgi:MAP3K TRAFs-binding domain